MPERPASNKKKSGVDINNHTAFWEVVLIICISSPFKSYATSSLIVLLHTCRSNQNCTYMQDLEGKKRLTVQYRVHATDKAVMTDNGGGNCTWMKLICSYVHPIFLFRKHLISILQHKTTYELFSLRKNKCWILDQKNGWENPIKEITETVAEKVQFSTCSNL